MPISLRLSFKMPSIPKYGRKSPKFFSCLTDPVKVLFTHQQGNKACLIVRLKKKICKSSVKQGMSTVLSCHSPTLLLSKRFQPLENVGFSVNNGNNNNDYPIIKLKVTKRSRM